LLIALRFTLLYFFQFNVTTTMAVKVLIPTPLQKFTNNQASLECEGGSIIELLNALETSFPGIKSRLCDDSGELRRFVNFYVNSEDIRFLDGKETSLKDGDEVSIVPAVAGG
jgi:molybdopterin synthase sulfur carrier subunit